MQFELDQVESTNEAHFGRLALDYQRSLGDFEADQIVGNERALDFLIYPIHCF